jgi:hypothetical protein
MKPLLLAFAFLLAIPAQADDTDLLRLKQQATADRICITCDGVGCVQCGGDGRTNDPLAPANEMIAWQPYAEALKSGKPLWIHITDSTDCPWCVKADAAFTDPVVVAASQNFACVLVDRATCNQAEYRPFAAHYNITVAPTCIFLAPDLTRLGRKTGFTTDYPGVLAIVLERATKYGVTGIPVFAEAKAKPQPLMPRLLLPRSILSAPVQSVCGPNGCH